MKSIKRKAGAVALWCCLALLLLVVSSCQQAKLKAAIAVANKECPISMGQTGDITSIRYEGDKVEYTLSVNEKFINIKMLLEHSAQTKASLKTLFQNPQGDVKELLNLVVACNSNLVFTYVGRTSGEKASFLLTTSEIKELLDQKMTDKESNLAKLKQIVESPTVQLPMKVDAVTTLVHLSLSDSDVVYLYQIDEAALPMKTLRSKGEQIKEKSAQALLNDSGTRTMVELCVACGKGIRYRYVGDKSGEKYEFRLTPEELEQSVGENGRAEE
jgi:hypothetical protein